MKRLRCELVYDSCEDEKSIAVEEMQKKRSCVVVSAKSSVARRTAHI